MADLTPLRIGITGSRRYASRAVIRSALRTACRRARPHDGHILVHGQCDPYHPVTNRPVPWRRAKELPVDEQGELLGGDWLAEWVALGMARWDGIVWQIERHPADWFPDASSNRYDRRAGFARNAGMVKLGADEWQAFALPCSDHRCYRADPHPSHGTAHCADLAVKAGIPLYSFGPDGPLMGGPGEWFTVQPDPGLWPDRGAMETAP
jgi:hypothetical protein